MEGLSARSILINAACQLIIFLYLLDNETSMVVLLSSGVGTAIEFWKVTKAMDVSFDPGRFPYIIVKDNAGYNDSNTKQHDADATRYLSYVLYPLIIGACILLTWRAGGQGLRPLPEQAQLSPPFKPPVAHVTSCTFSTSAA